ncbi:MAG: hypothetical protein HG457_004295 [Flavobacteriaceae bacterium]|nr:hypothetical protein [Flavobacteriaceae bacterium]
MSKTRKNTGDRQPCNMLVINVLVRKQVKLWVSEHQKYRDRRQKDL